MKCDPVEELVRALEPIADDTYSLLRFEDEDEIDYFLRWIKTLKKQTRAAISRFNAERGDGVWVPREPTAENPEMK